MEDIVDKSLRYIEAHIEDDLSVEEISKKMGYSKHHFSRVFSQITGTTVREYIIEKRLLQAARDIMSGEKIIDVAVKYHYETHSGFSKAFKRKFLYSPSLLIAMKLTERIINSEGGTLMLHEEIFDELIELMKASTSSEQIALMKKAYGFAIKAHKGKKRYSGEAYVTHPLYVAKYLVEMAAPIETVILGILHDCNEQDACIAIEDVRLEFGEYYYDKVKRISDLNISSDLLDQVDLESDEDIILVKLADRLHNMSTLKFLDQSKWSQKSKETMAIFSPLAKKIGMVEMKAKLDSLSLLRNVL